MEWFDYTLGEVCSRLKSGKSISSNMVLPAGEIPVIGGNGVRGYTDISNFEGECAVIGRQGAYCGNVRFFSGKAHMTEHAIVVVGNEKANTRYLSSVLVQMQLGHLSAQSAQPGLSVKMLSKLPIQLPSRAYQDKAAAILSSLDAKIENNSRINANLEAQAQALYKSWFVDFEPWGGVMPKNWEEGVYNDIIKDTISGDWGKETIEGNYTHSVACIRGCDFENISNGVRGKTPQRYILERNFQNKGLKDRDVVVEISGGTATVSTGRACLITERLLQQYDHDLVCTNFCRTIRPIEDYSLYLFYSWKYKYDQKVMFGYENGTSGIKNFAIKDFLEKEPLFIPPVEVLSEFNKLVSTMHDIIQHNGIDSTRLAALRDTLLPKLMKGEIEPA